MSHSAAAMPRSAINSMTDPNRAARTGESAPWPKGKPRNPPDPRWPALRKRIAKQLACVERSGEAGTNVRSAAYIAAACGVTGSTVCKWLAGRRNPPTSAIDQMAAWISGVSAR